MFAIIHYYIQNPMSLATMLGNYFNVEKSQSAYEHASPIISNPNLQSNNTFLLAFYNCRVGTQLNNVNNVTLDGKHWEYIGFIQHGTLSKYSKLFIHQRKDLLLLSGSFVRT